MIIGMGKTFLKDNKLWYNQKMKEVTTKRIKNIIIYIINTLTHIYI